MVSQLFDPYQRKNASDLAIVAALGGQFLLMYLLPERLRVSMFALVFIFWRMCYNFGIGWLLYNQSHHKRLVGWAKSSRIFESPKSGNQPRPGLYYFLRYEMEAKIPKDYNFETAPLEYNTWLLFRRAVDLILMSDFIAYCLFAFACGGRPTGEMWAMTAARWLGGWMLILFNLWVKLDAHRVVKDFAWYWGDFFFLIDQNLTFDGVFELAPHPMYSIGYVGFYGIAMLAASYKVLFISIFGHAAQLVFLAFVESPHIEKTYNSPPPPRKRADSIPDSPPASPHSPDGPGHVNGYPPLASSSAPSPVHNLLGLHNLDFHRVTDTSVILLQLWTYTVAFLSPSTKLWQGLFVFGAVAWRLWYSIGIGMILNRQSEKKAWTRHFVKYGESTEEAWRQWKGIYHISMIMCYTSFICAAWKMYGLPEDWSYSMALLRHVIGFAMVALQIWTITSIYESLGEFGWFFGDFFYDQSPGLTYGGIYRFLNNPERTIGLAGVWGVAIMTWSKTVFFLALLSHTLTLCFIQFVEKPHMQKLYSQGLRETSGVSKSIKRSLPSQLQRWSGSVDRVFDGTMETVEDFVDAAAPKLAAGFTTFFKDSTTLFKQLPIRVSVTRLTPELAGYDPKDYSLEIDTSVPGVSYAKIPPSRREGEKAQVPQPRSDDFRRLAIEYGAPIKVKWTAPLNHSKNDWIGLYLVGDNASREMTKVGSQGRWISTNRGVWSYSQAEEGVLLVDQRVSAAQRTDGEEKDFLSGVLEFTGDKLWWTQGVFEFRYHHDGKYNVMAMSLPFEIKISRFDEDEFGHVGPDADGAVRDALEHAMLPVVQNCFDRDQDVAPRSVDDAFGSTLEREGKYARRVVYAVQEMFGIEFAPEVVQADGNVRNLAWRICNAKKVLAPYSMSHSPGTSTPQ